ncbi:Virulence factors putative positive transcription regulator BvgA [compost metagenome]
MHKALIVDDHPVIRLAVRMLLEREHLDVVGEADNGIDAVRLVREQEPDLVILDISIPKLNGLEVIARLKHVAVSPRILVLTAQSAALYSKRCLQAGASGFITKSDDLGDLVAALHAVRKGYAYFPDLNFSSSPRDPLLLSEEQLLARLSDREVQILKMLADGCKNKEISEEIHLSPKTVSTYKTRIMAKLKVTSMVAMLDLARRLMAM